MCYSDLFEISDTYIQHSESAVAHIADPIIISRYTGFAATNAVTMYELAIKRLLIRYCSLQHPLLGNVAENIFAKVNGKIKIEDIKKNFLSKIDHNLSLTFEAKIAEWEPIILVSSGKSIRNSYNNIIQWRHDFVHNGHPPAHATLRETIESYYAGKCIIECLNLALS